MQIYGICWEYPLTEAQLKQNRGYGKVYWEGKDKRVHRLVYEVLVGPIPIDLEIDHRCRNRACYNPAHLDAVTKKENARRRRGMPRRVPRKLPKK